jgi:hypothetical protein
MHKAVLLESEVNMPKETAGDVFRGYVYPPSTAFPWVRFFRYPQGLKAGKPLDVGGVNPTKNRAEVAQLMGEEIIRNSKVLRKWFAKD